jgi:hypothetical protein
MKFAINKIVKVLLVITLVGCNLCRILNGNPSGVAPSGIKPSQAANSGSKPSGAQPSGDKPKISMYANKGYDWPGLCNTGPQQSPINIIDGGNTVYDSKYLKYFTFYLFLQKIRSFKNIVQNF